MKKLFWVLCAPVIAASLSADTAVYVTNNTPFQFPVTYGYTGGKIDSGGYWTGPSIIPAGAANLKVMEFSRGQKVEANKTYYFDTHIWLHPSITGESQQTEFRFTQEMKTKLVALGPLKKSDLLTRLLIPGKIDTAFHDKRYINNVEFGSKKFSITWGIEGNNCVFKINYTGEKTNPNELKILQYNIQQRPLYEGLKKELTGQHSTRSQLSTQGIPQAIAQYGADVVTINEAFTGALRPELVNAMKRVGYNYNTTVANEGKKPWSSGVMVFSKYPITKTKDLMYSSQGNLISNIDKMAAKGAQYVQIDKKGTLYNIFATHPNASYAFDQNTGVPLGDIGRNTRADQFGELRRFIDAQNIPANQPVIIIGDMNVEMWTEQKRGNRPENEYLAMLRFLNATHISQAGHKFSTDDQTDEWTEGGQRYLDYALYSNTHKKPKTAVGKVICLKEGGKEVCAKGQGHDLSDHYPLLAEFEF